MAVQVRVVSVLVFVLMGGGFVGAAEAGRYSQTEREALIQRELDCVNQAMKNHRDLQWQDVCYRSEKPLKADQKTGSESRVWQLAQARSSLSVSMDEEGNVTFAPGAKPSENKVEISATVLAEGSDSASGNVEEQEDLEASWSVPVSPEEGDIDGDEYVSDVSQEALDVNPYESIGRGGKNWDFDVTAYAGFREDDFNWNIAGTLAGTSPNVLSELTWQNVRMLQLKAAGQIVYQNNWVMDGSGAYSFINTGQNQDSDFLGDNRTSEFSRSISKTDDDDAIDLSAGVGYRFAFPQLKDFFTEVDDLWITVLGGYSYHELNLVDRAGVQVIPNTGPFAFGGINKVYEAEWKGPWVGFQIEGSRKKWRGKFRFEYHDADYSAEANWPLRSDFAHPISFIHEADGYGLVFGFGLDYLASENWAFNIRGDVQDWKAEDGLDRTFFANGTSSDTRLNEVNWESWAIMIGATYHFGL